ncbi:Asp-tRNA(Asn)/Glu-tRNA(Gln) amidotransferase subunit GatC [Luteococcus peritonei]|uniref:Aspartyl/glutamyl-tRNA(Asn/Gln) amidotransferase subunit C n=1 Tax=Luteococcus peritonei TaxID=88874 RepID=A0ABW4RYI3_9ACTN
MALTPQDVARLAGLARIDLTDKELTRLAPQLDAVLDAVTSVSQVAGAEIEPTSHALPLTNVFRADEVKPSMSPAQVLSGAPAAEDGRFRVPRILDEEA